MGRNSIAFGRKKGDSNVIELLLDRGAEISVQDEDGGTALLMAAECGQKNIVELLLDRGARINAQNENGATALHLAAGRVRIHATKSLYGSTYGSISISISILFHTAFSRSTSIPYNPIHWHMEIVEWNGYLKRGR